MPKSIMTRLILKDIYMNRMLIIGTLLAVFLSLFIATFSEAWFSIGSVLFITSMIVMGIFVSMYGVVRERENKSWLFVLSLPISTTQYFAAKLVAALISFLLAWGVALVVTVLFIVLIDEMPNGLLPFFILLMLFFFHNFAIFLAVSLLTKSEVWTGATIILTNTSITFFMIFAFNLPVIEENLSGPIAVWSPEIFLLMFYELAVVVFVLGFAMFKQSRRHDFV
ncbi:MAG: ABC-2 transporter permease [Pseudohongiellaceae bacterium]